MNRAALEIPLIALALALEAPWAVAGYDPSADGGVRFTFRSSVVNVEFASITATLTPPDTVRRAPAVSAAPWYGEIARRLPDDGPFDDSHYVPFAAEYREGIAVRAWCDLDDDGDLSDEGPLPLSAYPGVEDARSFLADLSWSARAGSRDIQVSQKIRVVLLPPAEPRGRPTFRIQKIFGRLGEVALGGSPHRALLVDVDADGLYTRAGADGVAVDLDDDGRIDTDEMSSEFAPLAAPFAMAGRTYEVSSVDPEGAELILGDRGAASPYAPPEKGKEAPLFTYTDTSGSEVRLADHRGRYVIVYFWSSRCAGCRSQAPGLRSIEARHGAEDVAILGVSYDVDRAEMERFRRENGQTWPTSFTGLMPWADPVGRLYRERSAGAFYLVDRQGILEGIYRDVNALARRLAERVPRRAAEHRIAPGDPER